MVIENPCEFPPLCCNCRTCNIRKFTSGLSATWSRNVRQRVGYPTPRILDLPECSALVWDIKVAGDIYLLYRLEEPDPARLDGTGNGSYLVQKRLSSGDLVWEYTIPGTGYSDAFVLAGGYLQPNRLDSDGSQVYVVCTLVTSVPGLDPDHFFALDSSTGEKVWGKTTATYPSDLRDIDCGGSGVYVACGDRPSGYCTPTTNIADSGWNVFEATQTGDFVRGFGVMPEASAVLALGGNIWVGSRHGITSCFCEDSRVSIGGCICRYSSTGVLELVCAGGEWAESVPGLKAQIPLLWGYVNRLIAGEDGDIISGHRIDRAEDPFFFKLDPTYGFLKSSMDLTGRDPPISAYVIDAMASAGGSLFAAAGSLLYPESGTAQRNRGYLTGANSDYNRTATYRALDSDGSDLVVGGGSAGCILDDTDTPYLIIPHTAAQPRLCGDFNTRGQAIVGCGPEDGVDPTCDAHIFVSWAGCLANMQATIDVAYSMSQSGPCPDSTHYWSGTIAPFSSEPFPVTSVNCEEVVGGVVVGAPSPCCFSFSGFVEVCYNCQEDTWVVKFTLTGASSGGDSFTMVFYPTITDQFCSPPAFNFTWDGTYTITGGSGADLATCCAGMSGCGGFNSTTGCNPDCTGCGDGAPMSYSADMSGFEQGAGTCGTCGSVSTVSLELDIAASTMGDCYWLGAMTFCLEALTVKLKMVGGTVTIDVLNSGGIVQATYTADVGFTCLGGGSFTRSFLSYTGTECTVWPTTISVTAA